jgi:hypothetical protein
MKFDSLDDLSVTSPTNWAVVHAPTANAQATISKAAVVGTRHVCTSISATLTDDGTAATANNINVNLRDGTTGAGTILWTGMLGVTAVAGCSDKFIVTGLNIPGTANTAMTLEFAANGLGAHVWQTVAMTGYDVV